MPASCRTAPARRRTRRSPTSPSRPTAGRSRPVLRREATAWRSTTSCCASRKSPADAPNIPPGTRSPASAGSPSYLGLLMEATRRTKIVATIGPACSTPEKLTQLVRAGVDGARLNLSHGTHDQHREWARMVRDIERELGRPIALIADLQGPKLRIGDLEEPLSLR